MLPNSTSLQGVEKSSDVTDSSFVNTNLSVWISNPKKPVATAEPVPHLNLTPRSRPSDVLDVVLSANAITGSSIVTVVDSTVVVVPWTVKLPETTTLSDKPLPRLIVEP